MYSELKLEGKFLGKMKHLHPELTLCRICGFPGSLPSAHGNAKSDGREYILMKSYSEKETVEVYSTPQCLHPFGFRRSENNLLDLKQVQKTNQTSVDELENQFN